MTSKQSIGQALGYGAPPVSCSQGFGSQRPKFLYRPKGKSADHDVLSVLITISALLVILLAAFGPFTQQAIRSFVCRVQVLPNNQASIPIAHYLNSTDVASVICDEDGCTLDLTLGISMKSAILGAMTAKEDGTNKLEFTCPTGDCEFKAGPTDSAYTSIGLCNECFDITSLVREWPGQDDTDMQRAQLNLTLEGMMTAQTSISSPYWLSSITSDDFVWLDNELGNFTQNITYLTYTWAPCTTNQTHPVFGGEEDSASEWFDNWICPISSYPSIPHMREDLAVLAVNCTFYPCMRSYVARVETGILRETPVSQVRMTHAVNEAVPISDPRVLIEPCFVEGQPYSHFNISLVPNMAGRNLTTVWTPQGELEAPVECVYRISYATIRSLSHYFQTELFGNTHCGWVAYYDSHNLGWITCPSEAWWLESLYNRGFATFESVNSLVQNISLAVSNQMRAKGTNANWTAPEFATGTMWNSTVCTRVDWAWMALPASLELITLVLLVTVITMSLRDHGKHPIWKSSTLPLVFHGLRDIKDASGNSEPPLSGATSPTPFPIDLAGMEKISKDLAVRLSTELGSSGFVVDQTSIHRRKSDTRHEAAP